MIITRSIIGFIPIRYLRGLVHNKIRVHLKSMKITKHKKNSKTLEGILREIVSLGVAPAFGMDRLASFK